MFSPGSSSYTENFPALEDFELPQQNTKHSWKIKTPVGKNPDGTPKRVSPAEAALNWQSENAVRQNQVLFQILVNQTKLENSVNKQLTSIDLLIQDLRAKIAALKAELAYIARTVKDYYQATELIRSKEAEKRHLENQLRSLEQTQQKQQTAVSPQSSSSSSTSLREAARQVFQPTPPLPYIPIHGYQPFPFSPLEPQSLFPTPYYTPRPSPLTPQPTSQPSPLTPPAHQPKPTRCTSSTSQNTVLLPIRSNHRCIDPKPTQPFSSRTF